jgi:DNA replication protein DnaC
MKNNTPANIKCKLCNDRKYVLVIDKWRPCNCLLEFRKQHVYQHAGIPPFFISYTWGDFMKDNKKMSNIVKLAKAVISKVKSGQRIKLMYILGEAQSGKQAFTCLLLKEYIGIGLSAKFINLDDLIQMEFDKERRDELEFIYNQCDVVCLRIGTVKEHGYTRYVIEKFINARKNNNKLAIITSRIDIETNAGLFGKEVSTMLNDGRKAHKIVMR